MFTDKIDVNQHEFPRIWSFSLIAFLFFLIFMISVRTWSIFVANLKILFKKQIVGKLISKSKCLQECETFKVVGEVKGIKKDTNILENYMVSHI